MENQEKKEQATAWTVVNNVKCSLVEKEKIKPIIINCQTFVKDKIIDNYTYFFHPIFNSSQYSKWPEKTNIACFHCTDHFDCQPCASVRKIDTIRNIYYVYGIFCSLNCVKAFLIEHEVSISTQRLLYFNEMCRNVYHIYDPIKPAYPRMRHIKFGGDLTSEQFHNQQTIVCRLLEPPFIPVTVVVETKKEESTTMESQIIEEKVQQSRFDQYFQEKGKYLQLDPILDNTKRKNAMITTKPPKQPKPPKIPKPPKEPKPPKPPKEPKPKKPKKETKPKVNKEVNIRRGRAPKIVETNEKRFDIKTEEGGKKSKEKAMFSLKF